MKRPVDVLYIGVLFGHGGDAMQMLQLAAGAAARGLRVQIAVPEVDTTIAFAEECRAKGISVVRTPWIRVHETSSRQNPINLVRLLRAYPASMVHVHTGDVCVPRLMMMTFGLLRLPHLFATLQSPYDTLDPLEPRARYWAVAAGRHIHTVFCPSEYSRRVQIRYGVPEERLLTVRNSVDVERFGNGDASAAYAALCLPPETPLVVFTSRLEGQKRPLDALHAFHRVSSEFPSAHLVYAGTGNLEADLNQTARSLGLADRVHFVGHQRNIPDWLAAATAWILPTEAENFSLALLEAMAAGCPVLSTICSGNDEVLDPGRNAIATAVGDVAAMADGLRRLLSEPDLRARLGSEARRDAQAYCAERMVEQYLRRYEEALAPRQSQPSLIGLSLSSLAEPPTRDAGADD